MSEVATDYNALYTVASTAAAGLDDAFSSTKLCVQNTSLNTISDSPNYAHVTKVMWYDWSFVDRSPNPSDVFSQCRRILADVMSTD
jgi:hypothetical protein